MDNKKKSAIGATVLLLLGVGAWFLFAGGVDPAVAALEQQRDRAFSPDATDAERDAFRSAVDQLSESQRRQFFERGREDRRRRMAQRMHELFSLPPDELRREAQQRAADIIAARQNPQAFDGPRRGGRPGGGPPGRGGAPGAGPPGGREGRPPMSEAQRDARRKQRLDRTDPGMRAQFSEFRRMVNTELEARGQEPMSGRDMRRLMPRS